MISGPLNSEGEVPGSPLTVLETNKTHPARVRCQTTCLNQQGTLYSPAMALILRGQKRYIPIPGPVYGARDRFYYSWDGLHFEIGVSYCEAQNNYTMEYEYLITSNASKIDRSVVFCGIQYDDLPGRQVCTCWGQSYAMIHAEVDKLADYQAPTNPSSTQATYTSTAVNYCYNINIIISASSAATAGWLGYALMTIILVIIIITITLPLTVGFLYLRSCRKQKSAPQCIQTVEQALVIKVEQPVASESAAVREEETSFSEKSDSNRSSACMFRLNFKRSYQIL